MYKKYRNWMLFTVAGVLALVTAFNLLMDPFLVFGSPLIEGINARKPAIVKQQRFAKAYAIRHFRPQAIILGTSRAEQGMDPGHPAFSGLAGYNLGLPGATIYESRRYFEHAVAVRTPEIVVLTLDFFAFNAERGEATDFSEERLASHPGAPPFYAQDFFKAALGSKTVIGSKDTVKKQSKLVYRISGFAEPARQISRDHRKVFMETERAYMKGVWLIGKPGKYEFSNQTRDSFENYRKIIDIAHQRNIRLYLVTSPIHARMLEAMDTVGLQPKFEEWKRALVKINAEQALGNSAEAFPLWDFTGYNSITSESVPDADEEDKRMQWYSEGAHYRAETGDLVLNKVFGLNDRMPPEDFGKLVTADNIDEHLASIRQERVRYLSHHPQDMSEIANIARELGIEAPSKRLASR